MIDGRSRGLTWFGVAALIRVSGDRFAVLIPSALIHQVQLNRTLSSQYVIRTQPSNICLSTLECAAVALSVLEQNDEIQEVR